MNTSLNNVARKFFSFASIAMFSAVGLGGCIANEEEIAAFENEIADDSAALTGTPSRVYINQDFNSMGYQEGRYVLGTGVNGGTCWIHENAASSLKSNYSIGANNGEWFLFRNANCHPVIGSIAMSLGQATGTNPVESTWMSIPRDRRSPHSTMHRHRLEARHKNTRLVASRATIAYRVSLGTLC